MNPKNLYFIAIIPTRPLFDRIQFIKEYIAQKYQCKQALKSPPHITLIPPFQYAEKKECFLIHKLEAFNKNNSYLPIKIELKGFNVFLPKVIYIDVSQMPTLSNLYQKTLLFSKTELKIIKDKDDKPFHPHITIAFRDVKKNLLPSILEDLNTHFTLEDHFLCTEISLLKHNGLNWEIKS